MGGDTGRRGWLRPRRRGRSGSQLAPMWLALGGTLALAVVVAVVVTWLGLRALHFREFQPEQRLSAATLYDLLKIAFAVAAGIGGVVALVTSYRRQRIGEFAERREGARLFNERFATAAGQLGDEHPAVRLAGVYAMAGLADDWPERRQTCVDVLCAYLRMPYTAEPAADAPEPDQQAFRAAREVRHTVIRVITAHLQPGQRRATAAATAQDWRGLDLDFTGAVFDGGDFTDAQFSGGTVSFGAARFSGGTVGFHSAQFTGGTVSFIGAQFSGGTVGFDTARFSGGTVSFRYARFSGGTVSFGAARFSGGTVSFTGAQFSGGTVGFIGAQFSGGKVSFDTAQFSGGTVSFRDARFSGGEVGFRDARFSGGGVGFRSARFSGGKVSFGAAQFSGGEVSFDTAQFSGGEVGFRTARFSGGEVGFRTARFSGSTVDFTRAVEWSAPPVLPDKSKQDGVMLPAATIGLDQAPK